MSDMALQGWEKLSENVDLMHKIFDYLDFKDKLRFAQVSYRINHIFRNYIWKVNYEKICIIKDPPMFHIKNETNLNKLKLNAEMFKEFLKCYANDIKELNEKCDPWLDIRKFPNLISLSYGNMTVTKPQLEAVAKYCKKLKKLKISTCTNKDKDMIELSRDIDIKTLLKMKQLKSFSLESCIQLGVKYRHFKDLVINSKIKDLSLKYYIEPDTQLNPFNKQSANSLEHLEICTTFEKVWWEKNYFYYLSHFENLLSLTLSTDTINDATVKVLAETCKKLKKLFIHFTTFEKVTNFSVLSSVEQLDLHMCDGLTQSNLRQMLTEMNLVEFCSMQLKYEGDFINFPISNKIQSLNIHEIKTCDFKGAYENNDNLRSLWWYDNYYSPAMEPESFECPNLEKLTIESGFISLEKLLKLPSLRTFSIVHSSSELTWSFISELLRNHVSLTEFTIEDSGSGLDGQSGPKEAFECSGNLKRITIANNVFQLAADFWLDLLNKNRHLEFVCLGWFIKEYMRELINKPNFPGFIKSIYINGVKVACSDLRSNLDYHFDKINSDTHLPIVAAYANKYEIILN